MSYDVELVDAKTKETLKLDEPHCFAGSCYVVGGTKECGLSITFNYSRWYYKPQVFPDKEDGTSKGIFAIDGLSGSDSIPILENAIKALVSMTEDLSLDEINNYKQKGVNGYWMPTRENAIIPLIELLTFAKLRPNGIWEVSA